MNPPEEGRSQAERTALAWTRTLLATSALAAFVTVSGGEAGAPVAAVGIMGAFAVVLLLASSIVPRRIWSRAQSALDGSEQAARPLPVLAMAGACTALALIALISTLTRGSPT